MTRDMIKTFYTVEQGDIIAENLPFAMLFQLILIFKDDTGSAPINFAELFNYVVSDVEFGGDECKPEYDAILKKHEVK